MLDELRELGETSIVTDPDQVPPLDQLDPERCYLSWTITVKTEADPERLGEAFLFFAEDSTVAIQRLGPDGKLVPVRAATRRPRRVPRRRRAIGREGDRASGRRASGRGPGDAAGPAATNGSTPVPRGARVADLRRRSLCPPHPRPSRHCRGCTPGSGSTPPSSTTWSGSPASWSSCPTT